MPLQLTLISAPAVYPLPLEIVKQHLRVDGDTDDAYIGSLIASAVAGVDGKDGWLGRALISQTWDYKLAAFSDVISVPLPPLQSVTSISYYDADGASQVLNSSNYLVETSSEPGRIVRSPTGTWPTTQLRHDAVTIRFVAGYGDTWNDTPEDLRHALLAWIAQAYDMRETVGPSNMVPLPYSYGAIMSRYRTRVDNV